MVQPDPGECKSATTEPLAVPMAEAARLMSLSQRMVYYLVTDGKLPSVKIGKRRLVSTDDIRRFLDEHRVVAGKGGSEAA
ncbi:MAG TPA: helix-turn-helix domain-containing protein [Acidimicrobiia bacterium]|jgi:excisionase family DNA binding protein|nr:helix-turn-helix domain-containing protein [Acidimicrobiia bacterium]